MSDSRPGSLSDAAKSNPSLDDFCQLSATNYDRKLVFTGSRLDFLRKSFAARFGVELLWLDTEFTGVLFFVSEEKTRFYDEDAAIEWISGFFGAFSAIDEYRNPKFTPELEANKCVHTEHCCHRHGCKYGYSHDFHAKKGRACPVETGEKRQSYPCESCQYEPSEPW